VAPILLTGLSAVPFLLAGAGGAWSVVVMRMDGRPGIEAHASIGLRFDFLTPAAAITLIAGAAPLTAAAVMAIRRRRVTPPSRTASG
jgi:hypothetical protein